MSDVTAISQEYEVNAELAIRLNKFVLSARKRTLFGGEPVDNKARDELAGLLVAIRNRLSHSTDATQVAHVPEEIVSRLAASKQGALPYFLSDLNAAVAELKGHGEISASVLDALDCIVDAADASASEMFRRLRRR